MSLENIKPFTIISDFCGKMGSIQISILKFSRHSQRCEMILVYKHQNQGNTRRFKTYLVLHNLRDLSK